MLDKINGLVRHFVWQGIDLRTEFDMHNVRLRLIGSWSADGREQSMPTYSKVFAIIVGYFSNEYINHLCYNICTEIFKISLNKSLLQYPRILRATC